MVYIIGLDKVYRMLIVNSMCGRLIIVMVMVIGIRVSIRNGM